ncbi:ribosome biogenesis protein WDR12 homolog [Pollicipes pollicipes]|uniref:ribosome biogenesis protein WDR12 homolog n=1 Tax=Pollicipes pollicipes TaxID=41117 RepID=UPI001884B99C|nr:ribosome biogenesis protein WDR12 homolog [Pollicipes pollicipes]
MASGNEDSGAPHIQTKFITKQEKYAVPDAPFSVPITVGHRELNSLINNLRSEADESSLEVEFDFLIHGEFLRQSVSEFLSERGISAETVVDIEYVEKSSPPEPEDSLMHDDWVSAVQASPSLILSGCYDSTLHLWTTAGEHKLTIPGHTEPVKDVCWISHENDLSTFASCSMDQSALLWKYSHAGNSIQCVTVFQGHSKSVDCVAGQDPGVLLATGSWDSNIHVWNTASVGEESQEQQVKKKRKTIGKAPVCTPALTLSDHKQGVSSLSWLSPSELASASWDHTIKIWDVELGGMKSQLAGNKAFFSISVSKVHHTLLAASADHYVKLYDPRSSEGSIVKNMYSSHKGWVTDVCWSTTREHEFVSSGQDMMVKHWDARGTKAPLYDLQGHTDKVLCCDWSSPERIVSGGADNAVKVFSIH